MSARADDGVIMAVEHRTRPLFGVQFHPESVLTNCGHRLLANFLKLAGISAGDPPPGDYNQPTEPPGVIAPRTTDGLPIHW